jgi:homoserine O-succinyltransferase
MPLIAHTKLPSFERLRNEGETVLSKDRANHQAIRELHIGLLNMILETPNFKVTNIIFESYEHRSKIILQLLTSLLNER